MVRAEATGDKAPNFGRRIRGYIRARYKKGRVYTIWFNDGRTQENTPEALVQLQKVGDDGDDEEAVKTSLDRFAQQDSGVISRVAQIAIQMETKEVIYLLARGEEDLFLETFSVRTLADEIGLLQRGGQRTSQEVESGRDMWQRMALWKQELEQAQEIIDSGARNGGAQEGESRQDRVTAADRSREQGMRQQDRAHQDMHKWIEENGFSKQWKKHKAQELEKLKAKAKGRRAGAFRHLKRLFFSENQSTRITQVEERRDKKKARRAGKINAMAAPPEVLMAAEDETIDRDVLDGGDATTAPSPIASSVPPTAARTPVPVPAQAAAGAARTTAPTHASAIAPVPSPATLKKLNVTYMLPPILRSPVGSMRVTVGATQKVEHSPPCFASYE
jgi:hypothetical protein